MTARLPVSAAARQRRHKARRAAGLRVLSVAIPGELLAGLEAAGLAGANVDNHSPELEDVVTAVLAGLLADMEIG